MGSRGFKTAVTTITAALIAAGAMTIVPGAYAANVLRVGANYKLTSNTTGRGLDVPGLAVDPNNQNHIVEANIDPLDLQCEYHVSFDGGQTWSGGDFTLPAPTATIAYPSTSCAQNFDSGGYAHFNTGIVFGSGQNVYATFSIHQGAYNRPENGPQNDAGNGDDAVVAHSTDGGLTFGPATIAIPGGGPTSANPGLAGIGMRPQIAVKPGGGANGQDLLYVDSWNCYIRIRASATGRGGCSSGGGDRRIWITRSDDGGATWSQPVKVSAANVRTGTLQPSPSGSAGEAESFDEQATEPSQPVIGPDGDIYIAYKNRDITNGTTCGLNPYRPATTGPKAGNWPSNLAWCVIVAHSTDGGLNWSQVDASQAIPATLINPRLAIDPSVGSDGKLYLVYQKEVDVAGSPPSDKADIFEQSSTNGGANWSATPVRVNDDNPGANQTNPYVAVGPDGVVDVAWWDQRNQYPAEGPTTVADVYFAQSTDGGASFGPNRRVTDRSLNESVGYYYYLGENWTNGFDWYGPVLLPLADGSILTAWPDSRQGSYDNGFQDIYLAKLTSTTAPSQSTIATATPQGLSVDLSRLAYPGGNEATGVESALSPVTKIVVANQTDEAGALIGAVLARYNWGPELLSDSSGLSPVAQADASRMKPEGAYIIGDTSTLSDAVSAQVTAATRDGENVDRIAPANSVPAADGPADEARQAAELMAPLATPTAVIVNPSTPEAAAGAALAASLGYPLLFVDSRAGLPDPTTAAINTLGITNALIVGGTGAVNAGVETALDNKLGASNVVRLGGADQYATSEIVAEEAVALGLPDNIVYAADGSRPIDAAVLGSAVARLGGMMLLTHGASTTEALSDLGSLGVTNSADRIVGAIGVGGVDPTLPPPPQHSLIVSLSGNGSGKVSGSGIACPGTCVTTQASGAPVSVTATAAKGSFFGGWSGACGGKGTCTGKLNQDLHVTATFFKTPVAPYCSLKASSKVKKGKITVTVKCNQSARVSVSGRLTEKLSKKHSKAFKLGPARGSVSANRSKNLTLKLPQGARNALGKKKESVKLTLTASNSNGTSHAHASIGRLKR